MFLLHSSLGELLSEEDQKLSSIRLELEEAKQAVFESAKKLRFKETATAAMAARDAAEKSLRLEDIRATRLMDRVKVWLFSLFSKLHMIRKIDKASSKLELTRRK